MMLFNILFLILNFNFKICFGTFYSPNQNSYNYVDNAINVSWETNEFNESYLNLFHSLTQTRVQI